MPMHAAKTPPIRRGFNFSQFKAIEDAATGQQAGAFEGYMSVFNIEDDGGDIVEPGAFSKTLAELRAKQMSRQAQSVPSGRYILPLFWGHDSQVCIGGIMDAKEDAHGVYVYGELDLNVEQARNAYSGLKSGYIPGMSFGYFAIKSTYDRLGVRHLKELSVFEATITPIPMHSGALVTEVKHEELPATATATATITTTTTTTASGGERATIRMQKREVKGSGGAVEVAADGTHAAYTGTHSHDHSAFKSQGGDDMHAHEHTHEGDSIHEHTHSADGKSIEAMDAMDSTTRPYRKARDFDTLFQSLSASDQLQDDWGDTFIAFVQCMSELMWQAHAQTNGFLMPEDPTVDIAEAAQANLDAFGKAVIALVTRSVAADFVPQIDWDGDQFIDPDGPNAEDAECAKPGYMSQDTHGAQTKAGRIMSAANHQAMGGMLDEMKKSMDALGATHKQLKAFHAKVDPNAAKPDASGNGNDAPADDTSTSSGGAGQPSGKSLTSSLTGAGTPPQSVTTPLTADDMSRSIRERMRAQRDAQRLAQAIAQAHA